MKIATISSRKLSDAYEGNTKNNYLYNDKELFDDGDLDWYDYGFRNYDPQIGRFVQLDPLTFEYPFYTPYQFAGSEPIANVDADGLEPDDVVKAVGSFTARGLANITRHVSTTAATAGKWIVSGFKDGVAISKVISTTGQLWARLAQATEILGIATKTLAVIGKVLQQSHLLGDLNSAFRIPNQSQLAFSNYAQAVDLINNDWHPIDFRMRSYYHLPEGGKINWSTGQIIGAPTSIEMVDGPETWLPMLLSGGVVAKLEGRALEEGAAKEGDEFINIYRVFGGDSKALGSSWTPLNPSMIKNYRNAAGLPNGNTGRFVIEGTVKKSNIILKKFADPLDGNKGGLLEYIIDPKKININRVSGVNPHF